MSPSYACCLVLVHLCLYCFQCHSDYSELPPLTLTNGPREHPAEQREEEENGYDFPKSRLPMPPARRSVSELGGSSSSSLSSSSSSSTATFSRLSLDSEAGATARKNTFTLLTQTYTVTVVIAGRFDIFVTFYSGYHAIMDSPNYGIINSIIINGCYLMPGQTAYRFSRSFLEFTRICTWIVCYTSLVPGGTFGLVIMQCWDFKDEVLWRASTALEALTVTLSTLWEGTGKKDSVVMDGF